MRRFDAERLMAFLRRSPLRTNQLFCALESVSVCGWMDFNRQGLFGVDIEIMAKTCVHFEKDDWDIIFDRVCRNYYL